MIIGEKSDFAIECYRDSASDHHQVLGRICCWAKNEPIGSIETTGCMIATSVNQFERTLEHLEKQMADWFGMESDQNVFDTIYEWNCGDNPPEAACPHGYGIHYFITSDGDSFTDIESFIRKKTDAIQLMIMDVADEDHGKPVPRIYNVSIDGFHRTVDEFIDWYNKQEISQQNGAHNYGGSPASV